MLSLCLVIQRDMSVTTLGFCLRVIVNEKLLNLKKTTLSALSVLLFIYDNTFLKNVTTLAIMHLWIKLNKIPDH